MPKNTIPIILWPDGDWCFEEHLNEYSWKSDDFLKIDLPSNIEDIDAWLALTQIL